MRTVTLVLAALTAAIPAAAQQGQRMAPPDHWLTWDSVRTALNLTGDQVTPVGEHYQMLNDVMKAAAAQRDSVRAMMQGGMSREEMRPHMQAMRATMDSLQTQVDAHYQEMRQLLTPEQQEAFDAFPKPMVAMRRPRN